MTTDWRDGFLFVGNRLSLDFANTRLQSDDGPVELLPDLAAWRRWLEAAGFQVRADWGSSNDATMKRLRVFRDGWRDAVERLESGKPLQNAFVEELNQLLVQAPQVEQVQRSAEGGWKRVAVFEPRTPLAALRPVLDDAVDLLVEGERSRLRQCDACVVHFYDTSKKGTRRWCSMNLCGNRHKVSAYYRRRTGAADRTTSR